MLLSCDLLSISVPALENNPVCTTVWRGTALKILRERAMVTAKRGDCCHSMVLLCIKWPAVIPFTSFHQQSDRELNWLDSTQNRKWIALHPHALKINQIKLVWRFRVFFKWYLTTVYLVQCDPWINAFLWCNQNVPNHIWYDGAECFFNIVFSPAVLYLWEETKFVWKMKLVFSLKIFIAAFSSHRQLFIGRHSKVTL